MRSVLVLTAFLLAGCMASSARRWNGHTRDELMQVRGTPQETLPLGDGGTVYIYGSKWNASSAGPCELRFVTDKGGIIRDTRLFNCRWNGWIDGPPSKP